MRTRLVFILLFLVALAAPAAADSRSWAAVKGKVPTTAIAVFGLDVASIQQSSALAGLWSQALTKDRVDQAGLDAVKAGCGVDPMAAVRDATVVIGADEKSIVVIALDGVDQATALRCAQAAATHQNKGVVRAKRKGKVIEYSTDGTDKFYAAWLAPDVVAFADDGADRKRLEKLTGGKGPRGGLASAIGKVSTSSPVWFAFGRKTPMKDKGFDGTLNAAFGTVQLAKGTLDGTATLVMASADEASKVATTLTQAIPAASQQVGKMLPDLATFVNTIRATAAAADVTITASIAEATLVNLVTTMKSMFP